MWGIAEIYEIIDDTYLYKNFARNRGPKGGSPEEKLLFSWILSILPPPLALSPIRTTCTIFLNVKKVDLNGIKNDSLSQIHLK